MVERQTGLGEAILRVNAQATDASIRRSLEQAVSKLSSIYDGAVFYCNVTANVVLKSSKDHTYSVYFG